MSRTLSHLSETVEKLDRRLEAHMKDEVKPGEWLGKKAFLILTFIAATSTTLAIHQLWDKYVNPKVQNSPSVINVVPVSPQGGYEGLGFGIPNIYLKPDESKTRRQKDGGI